MKRITSPLLVALRALVLLVPALHICGPAAAGSRARKPEDDRAKALSKLSPAEITKAGDAAAQGGDFGRAMNFYQQALEVEPTAALWFRVGYIYVRLDRQGQAAQAYVSALKLDPDYAAAHEELALLLLGNKQRDQAAIHFGRAAELDPKRWRSHNALGVIADAEDKHDEAVQHFRAALRVLPKSSIVLNNLGYSYYLSGDLVQAGYLYQQALDAEPGYKPAIANVGLLYARRREYPQAIEAMVAIMPRPKACNDVGYVAFQNGDLDEAERLLNEAIRLSPSWYETAQQNLKLVQEARERAAAVPRPSPASRPSPAQAAGSRDSSRPPQAVANDRSDSP